MRDKLNKLYEDIRKYEEEKDKDTKEIEKLEKEIEKMILLLEKEAETLSKIEKMKKQMDLSYLQSSLELKKMVIENNDSNNELNNLKGDIAYSIQNLEDMIYVVIRTGELKHITALKKLKGKYGVKNYGALSIIKFFENNSSCRNSEVLLKTMDELLLIYEYYKKIYDVESEILNSLNKEIEKINKEAEEKAIKNAVTSFVTKEKEVEILKEDPILTKRKIHLEKLEMLENLINEMAAEVIKEDMNKNNIILPDFVKGMRYFKHENEE